MDAGEAAGSHRSFPSFLWIVELVWRHNMMDLLQAAGASRWRDLDLQPRSLAEWWRLRVASAQVLSVVRRRAVARYDEALGFLEAAYRHRPGLVAAIKHMKIVFGLKTLVVMAMLRDGRGTVAVVSKVKRLFPGRLPEYQGRCSRREMTLMRKNHRDFKALAQALALDGRRRRRYVEEELEEQYGERYAQKVEERLLQYLRALEAATPADAHVEEILERRSPATEEEELLLDVVTSDRGAVAAATLEKLLLCDVPSCRPHSVSQPPEGKDAGMSGLSRGTPGLRWDGVSLDGRPAVGGEGDGAPVPKRTKETRNVRQFCSKHRRWVRSILQECPDDCSSVCCSPPLFPPSSSSSSSQDLTPSNLVPGPSRQPPVAETSSHQESTTVHDKACPPTRHAGSRLSRRFRRTFGRSTSKPSSEELPKDPSRPPSPVHFSGPGGRRLLNATSRSGEPGNPGDRLNSGSAGGTDARPGPSPSLLDQVASSSSTSKSNPTSPDCDVCGHQGGTSGPRSPAPRQSSGFEDRSDDKRRPDPQESPTSTKLSPKFRQSWSSGSSPPSSSSRDHRLPAAPPPPVHLFDSGSSSASKRCPTSPDRGIDGRQQEPSGSGPPSGQTSGNTVCASVQPEPHLNLKTSPESQDDLDLRRRPRRTRRSSAQPESRGTGSADKQSRASGRRPSNKKAPQYTSCPPSDGDPTVSGSKTSNQGPVTSGSGAQTARPPKPGDGLTPTVRLVDVFSHLNFKPNQASPCDSVRYPNNRTPSGSGVPPRRTPGERDTSSLRLKTGSAVKTPPGSRVSKRSWTLRNSPSNPTRCRSTRDVSVSEASTSRSSCCGDAARRRRAPARGLLPTGPPLRLSLQSQASLLQSSLLQPLVSLTRLEAAERRPPGEETEEEEERRPPGEETEEDDVDSSFDLNELYSDSSGSDGDEDPDPDYKPSLKKTRLLLEYENAKMAAGENTAKTKP